MSYDEQDAANEAYLENVFLEFREEHGAEIADELDTEELLAPIIDSHVASWPSVEATLETARRRLAEGANEEAIFHGGRAFEGYVRTTLVEPIRKVISERVARVVPVSFEIKQNHILANMRGLESGLAFAVYGIALVAPTPREAAEMSEHVRDFVRGSGGNGRWDLRNRLFHTVESSRREDAEALVADVEHCVNWCCDAITRRLAARDEARKREELAPERVEPLTFLVELWSRDPHAGVQDYKISVDDVRARMRLHKGLASLVAAGFIETIQEPPFGTVYRVTGAGRAYYAAHVERHVSERGAKLADMYVGFFLKWRTDILAERTSRTAPPKNA